MSETYSAEVATHLFELFVPRDQIELPEDYLPRAPGILPAGKDLLLGVGAVPESCRPGGWTKIPDGFMRRVYRTNRRLRVRSCGKHWLIERTIDRKRREKQVLVESFGNALICSSTHRDGMRIADFFDRKIGIAGLYWATL
jgi:hypothetical protein